MMADDNSDWLQRFLHTGIYQLDGPQPHVPPYNAPQSSVNRDLSLGLPSPYQASMTMTNNNPSQYFQRHMENGVSTGPPGPLYVDPREINAALLRNREQLIANSAAYQLDGNGAPQSVQIPSHSCQASPAPSKQRPDNLGYSGSQTAPQQVPTSSTSQQRPQMTAPVASPALEKNSQPFRASIASGEKHQGNSAHSPPNLPPPVSTSQPRPQEPASGTWQATQNTFQSFKTSHIRASPESVDQRQGNSAQSGPQSAPPRSTSSRPPMPPKASSPAIQRSPQPSGPSPTPTNQHVGNSTHSEREQASSLPPALQRPSMPQSASSSAIQNPQPTSRAPYPPPQQQYRNNPDHVTKKRRMENGSSDAKPRPESHQKTSAPQHPKAATPTNLSSFSYSSPWNNSLRYRTDIAQVLNKLDTLEKPEYDPTTIARDILIASGRHPKERTLNFHLFPLRDVFVGMTVSADLDTIRWDLVEAETRDQTRVAPTLGLSYLPSSQPHQPLPQPAPQLKPLNSIGRPSWPDSSQPQQSFVNTANPSPPVPQDQQFTVPSAPPSNKRKQASSPPSAPIAQQPTDHQSFTLPRSTSKSAPIGGTPKKSPVKVVNPRSQIGTPKQTPAINIPDKTPPVDLAKRGPAASPAKRAPPANQPKETPGANPARQTPVVSIPKRTPPQQVVAVSIPKREHSVRSKKRHKQSEAPKMVGKKQSMVEVSVPMKDSVSYPVFMCKWKDCHARLHNLSILKTHVMKIHIPHHLTCEWDGCESAENMAAAKLHEHIMAQHVEPIAWELGDGPSVRAPVDNDTSASPKPLARPSPNQIGGEDSLIFPASDSSIRAFNRVHENASRPQKAEEILKAVQRLKERIGVGLDPGGCELATPARNERVSNDEEVYELISKREA